MMKDLHVHTTYCDGKNTPEEMVLAAIEKGLSCLGFSVHSYIDFDLEYCIAKQNIPAYKQEIAELKEKYKDKIHILCGVEQDLFSSEPADGYDYVIGSTHYVQVGKNYIAVDNTEEIFKKAAQALGGYYALAEVYYENVGKIGERIRPDIIGHFDLITKFNEGDKLFDTTNPRYVHAWKKAADKLLSYNISFEINTGAISRGYRTTPYPAPDILDYLKKNNAKLLLSGDTHSKDTLCYQFDIWEKLLR